MASIIGNRNPFNDYFGLCCKCCRSKRLADVNHNRFLLLKEINTDVQLRGLLATIQATLVYQNSFESPVEVEYRMPLQSTDVITDLTVTFSGKQVKAVVKEIKEAKNDYDDAIASGRQAVFAEQDTKDIFNILFGNLPPGASAEVKLTLVQELLVTEEEAIRFILPSTLKPRYQLTNDSTLQAAFVPTPSTPVQQYVAYASNKYAFSFTMSAEFPGGFKKVESPSHNLSSEKVRDDLMLLRLLEENTSLDLVVLLFPAALSIPIALLEDALPHPAGTSSKKLQVHTYCTSRAFTINFIPSFPANSDCPCEFIFVIDRSGSMSGGPIQNAKNTLELMLRSLEPGFYFNIVGFGSSYTFLYPESVEYTQKNLEHASIETQAMNANLGGTNVMEPLNAIYNTKKLKGLPRQILLLTDGSVSNIDSVVQVVKNHACEARVFGIGIGSGVSTELVNGISEAGRGRAVFVSESERMQSKILKLMSDAMSPCCTDIKLSYNKSKMCIFPQNLPQLFSVERLVVYGFILGTAAADTSDHIVTLEYNQNKATHLHRVKLRSSMKGVDAEKSSSQLIHKLACRAALNELENVSDKLEECILLSCSMGVVCKLTAMVAVDVTEGNIVERSMQLYKVPDQYQQREKDLDILLHQSAINSASITFGRSATKLDKKPQRTALIRNLGGFRNLMFGSSLPQKRLGAASIKIETINNLEKHVDRCFSKSKLTPSPPSLTDSESLYKSSLSTLKPAMTFDYLTSDHCNDFCPTTSYDEDYSFESIDFSTSFNEPYIESMNSCSTSYNEPYIERIDSCSTSYNEPYIESINSCSTSYNEPYIERIDSCSTSCTVSYPPNPLIQSVPGSIDSFAPPPLSPRSSPDLSPLYVLPCCSLVSYTPPADPLFDFSHESIAKLQSALGYWESTPQLLNLLSLSNKQLDICPVGIDAKLWITLLVVAFLEKKYPTYKDEWFLIVKKARKWTLICQLPPNVTLEELSESAQKVFE